MTTTHDVVAQFKTAVAGKRSVRLGLAALLVVAIVGGIVLVRGCTAHRYHRTATAYFSNTSGMFVGDQVRILGVPVGKITKIDPEPLLAKVTFFYDSKYKVPADVKAVILSPSLVTSRAIQLTPPYTQGAVLADDAVIPQDRTAVPVEFDDFREQLRKLTAALQPTKPGGVSTLGEFINTAADNLRGNGADIRKTIVELSQAFSALGDHSSDLFGSVKNLATLVTALGDSSDLMRRLNIDLAAVTDKLSNSPDEVGRAVSDIDTAVGDVTNFVATNKEPLGTTVDKLASITTAMKDSIGDIKQTLHVAPTTFQNFINIYQPAQGTLTGVLALTNFSNTISFLCGAVQAAARLGAEQSSKLCVQYLAPIIKNRQYNFPPLGENLFVGASARPNEITYSEDWMRPDYVAPPKQGAPGASSAPPSAAPVPAVAADPSGVAADPHPTNPSAGLSGLMVPKGAGS